MADKRYKVRLALPGIYAACIQSFFAERSYIEMYLVLNTSVYDTSSLIARNVRVTSKHQCTCFCGLPATYTLHSTMVRILLSLFFRVLSFGTSCKHTTVNNARNVLGNLRRRVVCARGTWYLHKQQLGPWQLSLEHCAHHRFSIFGLTLLRFGGTQYIEFTATLLVVRAADVQSVLC